MKEMKVCLEAAAAGAKVIQSYHGKTFNIRHKGATNLVTEVDEKAQKAIVKVIQKYFKEDSILAEEGDLSTTRAASRRWIVDPLDGTTNFAHGYPKICVSIAFEQEENIMCGVVHDPNLKEVFHAEIKKGAFVNKKRIHVSQIKNLNQSLLVTGFPYDLENPDYENVPYFVHFLKQAQALRRDGSAALNLAYVAAGRFDGLWELSLKPWDYSAGVLLIREAGGITTHMSGREIRADDHALLCANPFIYQQILEQIRKVPISSRL
ncbi:MAG: monophosphatase [Bacteriovoracaceae bacterium]|nr:monophosphatase [Bacteriovoracaceae bacterium]